MTFNENHKRNIKINENNIKKKKNQQHKTRQQETKR